MEKQIEEMARILCRFYTSEDDYCGKCPDCVVRDEAKRLYNAGYRKQIEGEWELHSDGSGTCSECHKRQKNIWDYDRWQPYCGECGAKMKGANE